ncbi:DUF3106 domain-containing protein [Pseudoxanthomonas yeongjuensis]|uniref:DUF3106 domain-containing protein n=1 Tax=Pseudoxanthomonas yeongjuensis TaxID=377616 RepID=UPI001391C61B|nr:DUF3106 domain-containing protein [Pseudoxanthomonas yeongjuensis]
MRSSERAQSHSLPRGTALLLAALLAMLSQWVSASGPETLAEARALQEQRAARLQAMSSERRVQFGQRLAEWKALPLAEREDRRARYQAWLQLEEAERLRLRAVAAEIATFPPQRQQALRAQFDALDASQRRGWRLGPTLGADYEKLQSLLAFVPSGQRLPLLASLRAMTAGQRAELAVLAQRTPPQDRQALRAELLAQPGGQLEAWLRRKLAR